VKYEHADNTGGWEGTVVQVVLHVELGVLGVAEEGLIEPDLLEKVLVGLFLVKADSEGVRSDRCGVRARL